MGHFIKSVVFFLSALSISAAPTVNFHFNDIASGNFANKKTVITDTAGPSTNSGSGITVGIKLERTNDASGNLAVTNMLPSSYRVDCYGTPAVTFYIRFTNADGTLNAHDYVTSATNLADGLVAYTKAQSDARFSRKIAPGNNVTFTTNSTTGVITIISGNTASDTNAVTNAVSPLSIFDQTISLDTNQFVSTNQWTTNFIAQSASNAIFAADILATSNLFDGYYTVQQLTNTALQTQISTNAANNTLTSNSIPVAVAALGTQVTDQFVKNNSGRATNLTVVGSITGDNFSVNLSGEASFSSSLDVGGSFDIDDLGNVTSSGDISAASFAGDGSGLTNLDASQLLIGTVPQGRLATNNQFSGAFLDSDGTNRRWTKNGNALTNLSAANLSGTQANGTESTNTALLNSAQTVTAAKTFNGVPIILTNSTTTNIIWPDAITNITATGTNILKGNTVTIQTAVATNVTSASGSTNTQGSATVKIANGTVATSGNISAGANGILGNNVVQGSGYRIQAAGSSSVFVDDAASSTLTTFKLGGTTGGTFSSVPKTPSQITGDQNDYNPGSRARDVRLSTDASRNITGLVYTSPASEAGEEHILVNVGSQPIVLVHESASSTAANRFHNTTGADITLSADQQALLWYDATTARWRVSKMN